MKPWEEEWEYIDRGNGKSHLHCVDGEEEYATFWGDDDAGRARLAAAASAMAMLLIGLEWACCCRWFGLRHKPECEWLRVMRLAGVIE